MTTGTDQTSIFFATWEPPPKRVLFVPWRGVLGKLFNGFRLWRLKRWATKHGYTVTHFVRYKRLDVPLGPLP